MTEIIKYERILGKTLYKWFALLYLHFKSFANYRVNIVSYLFSQFLTIAGTLIIWYYSISNGVESIEFKEIVSYYLIGQIFLIKITPQWSISEDIQYGNFSNKLLKPESVWISYIVEDLGVNLFTNFIKIILSVAVALIFFSYIVLPSNPLTYLLFLVSILLAFIISILINFIFSFITFYVVNSHGILELLGQAQRFFSGWLFPLDIISLTRIFTFLPFAFTYYYPVQIFLERQTIEQSVQNLGFGFLSIFILFFVCHSIYHNGLKQYESIGL
ncbi:MAG: ABC-2 family transporter protein [Patescibacteria group bacterium]